MSAAAAHNNASGHGLGNKESHGNYERNDNHHRSESAALSGRVFFRAVQVFVVLVGWIALRLGGHLPISSAIFFLMMAFTPSSISRPSGELTTADPASLAAIM